ncbi:MAG: twin-arginine translocase TatA/TatE family subunit [Actinomyces graevenitzii]|nr:twin-arginine translocase TatA/TatE family subunit [Actinomyces graevenitzii]
MFGISGGEFLVILLVIMVVIGPSRLPEYTRTFAQFVRKARVSLEGAKASVREELGPELSDLKLADFDPRNYDPRKIVRDVMGEDLEAIKRDLSNPLEALKETVTDTVSVADDVATSGRDALQSQPGQAPLAEPTDTNDTAGVNAEQASDDTSAQATDSNAASAETDFAPAVTDAPEAGDSGNFDDTAYINPPDSVTSAQVDTDNSASLVNPTLADQNLDTEPSNADSDAATNADAPADTSPTAAAVDAAAANIALAPLSDADAALLAQLRSQVELSPRDILRAANAAKRPAPAAAGVEL